MYAPAERLRISSSSPGVTSYVVDDDGKAEIHFGFLGDELLHLGFVRHVDDLKKNKNKLAYFDDFREKFGTPTSKSQREMRWYLPTIDRSVRVVLVGDYLCFLTTRATYFYSCAKSHTYGPVMTARFAAGLPC